MMVALLTFESKNSTKDDLIKKVCFAADERSEKKNVHFKEASVSDDEAGRKKVSDESWTNIHLTYFAI